MENITILDSALKSEIANSRSNFYKTVVDYILCIVYALNDRYTKQQKFCDYPIYLNGKKRGFYTVLYMGEPKFAELSHRNLTKGDDSFGSDYVGTILVGGRTAEELKAEVAEWIEKVQNLLRGYTPSEVDLAKWLSEWKEKNFPEKLDRQAIRDYLMFSSSKRQFETVEQRNEWKARRIKKNLQFLEKQGLISVERS